MAPQGVEDLELRLRRYRCRACGAVVRVAPRGLVTRRHYTLPTILLGLAWWSLAGWSPSLIRSRLRPGEPPGPTAAGQRWTTLLRWARRATVSILEPGRLRERVAARLHALRRSLGGLALGRLSVAQVVEADHHVDEVSLFGPSTMARPPKRIPE